MTFDRRRQRTLLIGLLCLGLAVSTVAGVSIGAYPVHLENLLSGLLLNQENRADMIIAQIRFPRVVFAILVGAALGASGAALQVLFRNPLADPALLGISSGAALGAVSCIVLGAALAPTFMETLQSFAIPLAAFLAALVATIIVIFIGGIGGKVDVPTMLLAGIAINAIAQTGIGAMTFIADDQQLRDLSFWSLGSLAVAGWNAPAIVGACILFPTAFLLARAPDLNRYLLGEAEAQQMGVNVVALKWCIVLGVALSVGAAVSFAGIIGFVGLVVPHLVRLAVGPDNRIVVPGAMLAGATLMVLADILARTIAIPAEIPVGLILGAVGGPFFLWLLTQSKRKVL